MHADARSFTLGTSFALILAPMQLVQILGGRDGRAQMLERVHAHLTPGGVFAAALSDPHDAVPDESASPRSPTSSSATAGCSRASPSRCGSGTGVW